MRSDPHWQQVPVVLTAPSLPVPRPHPGCRECGRLDQCRRAAGREHDYSLVSDCNVRMREHQRRAH